MVQDIKVPVSQIHTVICFQGEHLNQPCSWSLEKAHTLSAEGLQLGRYLDELIQQEKGGEN